LVKEGGEKAEGIGNLRCRREPEKKKQVKPRGNGGGKIAKGMGKVETLVFKEEK